MKSSIFPPLSPTEDKSEFASWKIRVCSFLIDYVLWYAVFALVIFVTLFTYLQITGYGPSRREQILEEMHYMLIFPKILIAAIIGVFLLSKWQATPGQRVLGIYVCSTDGNKLKNWVGILRCILLLAIIEGEQALDFFLRVSGIYTGKLGTLDSVLFSMGLMLLFIQPIARTKERTGLHDMLCNARVKYGKL